VFNDKSCGGAPMEVEMKNESHIYAGNMPDELFNFLYRQV